MSNYPSHDKYYHTINGLIKIMYGCQCANSIRRKHPTPEYTFEEFYDWVTTQPNFNTLYASWEYSEYSSKCKPSVDRLDDSKHYSFDNIRLVTWRINETKQQVKVSRPVQQYSLEGVLIAEHASLSAAARAVNKPTGVGSIGAAVQGIQQTAYGFIWK